MSQQPNFKRWYDRQPKLSRAFKLIIILPDEVRSIISESLMLLANREFDAAERENSFRTVGSEKVMALHKSKNRRREYDQNEQLHKAMNYLYVLSDDNQDFMAEHILKMVEFIQKYFATCHEFKAQPSLEDVATVTNTYVEKGTAEVENFLKQLREEFFTKLASPEKLAKKPIVDILADLPSATPNTTTQDDGKGMKVKKLEL